MLGVTFITLLTLAISSAVVGYVSLPSLVPTADIPAAERGTLSECRRSYGQHARAWRALAP